MPKPTWKQGTPEDKEVSFDFSISLPVTVRLHGTVNDDGQFEIERVEESGLAAGYTPRDIEEVATDGDLAQMDSIAKEMLEAE